MKKRLFTRKKAKENLSLFRESEKRGLYRVPRAYARVRACAHVTRFQGNTGVVAENAHNLKKIRALRVLTDTELRKTPRKSFMMLAVKEPHSEESGYGVL